MESNSSVSYLQTSPSQGSLVSGSNNFQPGGAGNLEEFKDDQCFGGGTHNITYDYNTLLRFVSVQIQGGQFEYRGEEFEKDHVQRRIRRCGDNFRTASGNRVHIRTPPDSRGKLRCFSEDAVWSFRGGFQARNFYS